MEKKERKLIVFSDFGNFIDSNSGIVYTESAENSRMGGRFMIQRNEYLDALKKWKDQQVIKVITGIRRCGKSTLLQLYQAYLREQGVAADQIIAINFEELESEDLLDIKPCTPM